MMAHAPMPVPAPGRSLYCRPMDVSRPILVLLLIALLLAGCGRKGPLYLPEEATPPAAGSN